MQYNLNLIKYIIVGIDNLNYYEVYLFWLLFISTKLIIRGHSYFFTDM